MNLQPGEWGGNVIICGGMGRGKTHATGLWLTQDSAPGIMWDPTCDAKVPGAADASFLSDFDALTRALQHGWRVVYRSAGAHVAVAEVRALLRVAAKVASTRRGPVRLALCEAHAVAADGAIDGGMKDGKRLLIPGPMMELEGDWNRARHLGLEIALDSQVVQRLSYKLRETAGSVVIMGGLAWGDWWGRLGVSKTQMDSLRGTPPGTHLIATGGVCHGPFPPMARWHRAA